MRFGIGECLPLMGGSRLRPSALPDAVRDPDRGHGLGHVVHAQDVRAHQDRRLPRRRDVLSNPPAEDSGRDDPYLLALLLHDVEVTL